MIIIRMSGGMGNQMFQYALYLRLTALGREVKFDDVTEYRLDNARPVMLSAFGLDYPRASREEITALTDASPRLGARVRRLLMGRNSLEYHEKDCNYDGRALELDPAYLCGCFQSERYFQPVEEQVRAAYRFREDWREEIPCGIRQQFLAYEQQIEGSESVGIHIRRGDYLAAADVYGGICTEDYYRGAAAAVRRLLAERADSQGNMAGRVCFFVFTNDEQWCRAFVERQPEPGSFTVVEGAGEEYGWLDMLLLSRCRHQIIANSSFSWWAAWLNDNPDKCVAAPSRWLRDRECGDIYTSRMVRIDERGELVS